jgi:hypothetical protein
VCGHVVLPSFGFGGISASILQADSHVRFCPRTGYDRLQVYEEISAFAGIRAARHPPVDSKRNQLLLGTTRAAQLGSCIGSTLL